MGGNIFPVREREAECQTRRVATVFLAAVLAVIPWIAVLAGAAPGAPAGLPGGSERRAGSEPLIPYGSDGWLYCYGHGGDCTVTAKVNSLTGLAVGETSPPVFIPMGTGTAPFGGGQGSYPGCEPKPATPWPADEENLFVAKAFVVPPGTQALRIGVSIDNDVTVWVNNALVGHQNTEGCPYPDKVVFYASQGFLPGPTLLTAHAVNRGGGTGGDGASLDIEVRAV